MVTRIMSQYDWNLMQGRRDSEAISRRIQAEAQLAADIRRQEPGTSRDEALRRAARIMDRPRVFGAVPA